MQATRLNHDQREALVLGEVRAWFPDFAGGRLWAKVPDDPPDFVAGPPTAQVGLELVEWLDGPQMNAAQGRKAYREGLWKIMADGWEEEYQPAILSSLVISPNWEVKISTRDQAALRTEFWQLLRISTALGEGIGTGLGTGCWPTIVPFPSCLSTFNFSDSEGRRRAGSSMVIAGSISKGTAARITRSK